VDKEITDHQSIAGELVAKIRGLYKHWNLSNCKGQVLQYVGLQEEPYSRYFDNANSLTPRSGLIQIGKYKEIQGKEVFQVLLKKISFLTKKAR
jgi:hypothetical protein